MPDRKKVINQIEVDIQRAERTGEMLVHVGRKTANDALELLKEQEAVEPEWKGGVPFCGNCGHRLQKKNRNMVGINCPMCKRSVKWE